MRHELIAEAVAQLDLEELVTSPDLGALPASDHQRLVCRVAQGLELPDVPRLVGWGPEIAERSGRAYMVGETRQMPRPQVLYLLSGIRTGKSLITACIALRAALTCDLSGLRAGEVARVSVLSLRRDLAAVIREHLDGMLARSPLLGILSVRSDAESVLLQHPSGQRVEVAIVAGSKAGAAVVARWSAGVIVDEAPRFAGAAEGVVNLEDLLAAARGRLLPGAQMVLIGSPWAARGPVFDAVQVHWHHPSHEVAVLRAAAPALNPAWWTPERVREVHAANPTAYIADVLGEFVELSTDALSSHDIEACRGDYQMLSPGDGLVHIAAIDPALRLNAWTLVIARRSRTGGIEVALARQWMPGPGRTLDPDATMGQVAEAMLPYGVTSIYSDQHLVTALAIVAERHGLGLVQVDMPQHEKCTIIAELATKLAMRKVRLPDVPQLLDDLRRVRRVATSGRSGLRIELPTTADGRHCDYVPALMLCLRHLADPIEPEHVPEEGGYEALVAKHRRRARRGIEHLPGRRGQAARIARKFLR